MDRAGFAGFYTENSGLVYTVTTKGYARAMALGANIGFDDLYQEMSEVFIRAYDCFDPTTYKFSTYYMRAAFNRINKLIEKVEVERIDNGTKSVEEMGAGRGEDGDDLAMTVEDVTSVGPEEAAAMKSMLRSWRSQLSPVAAELLDWITDPPDFLELEFEAQQAHASLSRSGGTLKRARLEMDLSFAARVMRSVTGMDFLVREALKEVRDIAQNTL